jgi:serine/threonine-protein kinase
MSPEQAAGRDDIDGRADVWSLGVVLYEGLTGQLPHEAPNYNALMVRILTQDVESIGKRKPDLPPYVIDLVDRCLERERDNRPTAGQLSSMLEAAVRELRADRFRRSGGRRRDDMPSLVEHQGSEEQEKEMLFRLVMVGAGAFLSGSVIGILMGYFIFS